LKSGYYKNEPHSLGVNSSMALIVNPAVIHTAYIYINKVR